jgi:signal transduction histidine kinase
LDLAEDGDAVAAQTSLSEIALDLAELESLVDDILVAARMELSDPRNAGLPPLHFELLSPHTLVEQALSRFRNLHPERNTSFDAPEALPHIQADVLLLRRALSNLLENAHKYTTDETSPIRVRAFKREDNVVFEVEDQGTGIAPSDMPHVFRPFFRAERSRTRTAGGVGLGLTLVARIVEAHGGRVDIQSQLDAGTRVTVSLPSADIA